MRLPPAGIFRKSPPEPSISPRKSMKPAPSSPSPGGFDQHGARAIAEQDAGGAVGVIDDAAHGVGADHQHLLVRAGRHQVRADGQAVDEAGTGRDQVEAPGALRADAVLHQAGGGGEQMSGVTVQTMIASSSVASMPRCASAQRAASIAMSEVAISGRGDVALADAGALHDPLVVGVDHLFQVLIGQHARRRIAPERADFRLWQCFVLESLG